MPSMLPTFLFDFQKPCAEPCGEFGSLDLWWFSVSSPSSFPVFCLSNLKDTAERRVPGLSSGPIMLCVPECTAVLGTFVHPQLRIQKEVGEHSRRLHPEQLQG